MTRLARWYRRLYYGPYPSWAAWPNLLQRSVWCRIVIEVDDNGQARMVNDNVPGATRLDWARLVDGTCRCAGEIGRRYGIRLQWEVAILNSPGEPREQ